MGQVPIDLTRVSEAFSRIDVPVPCRILAEDVVDKVYNICMHGPVESLEGATGHIVYYIWVQ